MSLIRRLISFFSAASLASLLVLIAAPADGQAVASVDPRALAMGGGYVALADGWGALQWNPAGLWVSGRREVGISFGEVPLEGGSWIDALRSARGLPDAVDRREATATILADNAGLAGERAFGFHLASTRWGGAFQQVYYVDEVSRLRDGHVEVDAASLRAREFLVAGAHPLAQGRFVIGVTAKLVQAEGRFQRLPLDSIGVGEFTARELSSIARSGPMVSDDTVFSLDVGALIIASPKFRIGGVIKNLTAPELGSGLEAVTRLPRQIRVGGLALLHPRLKLAIDFDLTTDVFVDGGRERRELGGGFEWSAAGVAARGGLLFDVAALDRRPLYTFGLGLSGQSLRADLAGSFSPSRRGFGWIGALAAEF